MQKEAYARRGDDIVQDAFVCCGVVRLAPGPPQDHVRLGQCGGSPQPRQDLVNNPCNDADAPAIDLRVKATEAGYLSNRTHPAYEAVALYQRCTASKTTGTHHGGNAPGPASQNGHSDARHHRHSSSPLSNSFHCQPMLTT